MSKIQKWGNSLGVRIPAAIAEKLRVEAEAEVDVSCRDGAIVIVPIERQFVLADLLDGITKDNLHTAADDAPMGREVW